MIKAVYVTRNIARMKPRLLVVASTYPRWIDDSEPAFVHELSKRLTQSFDVSVVCPGAKGAYANEFIDGVDIHRFRYAPDSLQTLVNDGGIVTNLRRSPWKWLLLPGFFLAQMLSVRREVRRVRPDVVHAHWLIPQGLLMALLSLFDKRMPPFVVTSHGADLYALRGQPWRWLKQFVAQRSSAFTVVSRSMRDELRKQGIDASNVRVEPMGVDLDHRFTPNRDVLRSDTELLFVGRLVEKKGLRYLIDAMPAVLQHLPSVRLKIAGFGPERSALEDQVKVLGLQSRVDFLGPVQQEELPSLYRQAALFVGPFIEAAGGDQEGLGLVTVEAIGCGCPVIVSDLPAVSDVVDDPSLRVPLADPEALAAAIINELSRDQSERRQRAATRRKKIVSKFDWPARASAYANVLKSVSLQ